MPVPGADSHTSSYSAFSGSGALTTGVVRVTALWRWGTSSVTDALRKVDLIASSPQQRTKTVSSAHGTHARTSCHVVGDRAAGAESAPSGSSSVIPRADGSV